MTSATSDTIKDLLSAPGISVMSFERADAYIRLNRFLSKMTLPKGAVDLARNLPAEDIVLLAPAIFLRATIYLQRVLTPFPNLVIPSLADEAYLANIEGTPVAAYNALFDALYHFEDTAGPKLNVPTLIFIDEQDEFIPLGGLKKLAVEHKLDKWQLYIVRKAE